MLTTMMKDAKSRGSSLNLPTPEVFAQQALNTLGFSSYRTAGYWCHSLLIKSGILEYTGMAKKANQRHILNALKKE